jgi:hypothetical protein
LVVVTPLPDSAGTTISLRTNGFGAFETRVLPAGAYLEEAPATFLNIRLPRFGSVSGIIE